MSPKKKTNAAARDWKAEKNWLEWTVFGLGLLLVTGTLGFLVYDGARLGGEPPSIEVKLGTPERRAHNYVVPVTVTNHGDETAEGVVVEVSMEGVEGERGEFVVAFLPRRSTREGWVAFRTDPTGARLTPRVLGYEKP
ncbi:MAG TPA: hypothetical protein VFX96_14545 [Pyrinomonadaceae bacterium]|nr:hypothetical protein [Pyrinomonadaceae bacterium]